MRLKEIIDADTDIGDGIRVDSFISENSLDITRSQLKTRNASVFINDEEVKFSRIIKPGDVVLVEYDSIASTNVIPEKIDINILYEDENVIVLNKKQGMVVHPAAGNYTGTLVNALLYHIDSYSSNFINEEIRPGIVHRLDKETSGVIIAAKNVKTHEFLSGQFRLKTTGKKYIAVVKGKMKVKAGIIDNYLIRDKKNRKKYQVADNGQGKRSVTGYNVLKEFDDSSLVILKPETGRTHQLRVLMQHSGTPIIGDPVYSRQNSRYSSFSLMLHAYMLEIEIPEYGKKTFIAPLPQRFKIFIKNKSGQ